MNKLFVVLTIVLLAFPTFTFANFTDNDRRPTNNNVPLPLNTSNTTQLKNGPLVSDRYMQADVFYDRYNSGYYLQPRGTNRLNYLVADNTLTYGNSITNGEVQGAFFRDRNNGNFYVDPNGSSVQRDIFTNIIYDRNDTRFYLNPNNASRVQSVYADYLYSYGSADVRNIYLRDAGKWASQVGEIYIRNFGRVNEPAYLQCPNGDKAIAIGATHSDEDGMFRTWRFAGDSGIAACERHCNGEYFESMWISCQRR